MLPTPSFIQMSFSQIRKGHRRGLKFYLQTPMVNSTQGGMCTACALDREPFLSTQQKNRNLFEKVSNGSDWICSLLE